MKIPYKHLIQHETKNKTFSRFLIGFAVLALYTLFLILRFGQDGISPGLLTWSAFVMATPVADGGLLLDFPIRLMTGMRMIYSELLVWVVAIGINIRYLVADPAIYEKTIITKSFHKILVTPWPLWIIIALSLVGTFISIFFGDELLDVVFHRQRKKYMKHNRIYKVLVGVFIVAVFYFLYKEFLGLFGLSI